MVNSEDGSGQNGEHLLKIQKLLVQKQQKLAKDESDVNNLLQRVTELLQNQKNQVKSRSSPNDHNPGTSSTPTSHPLVNKSKLTNSKNPSDASIPEEISSATKSVPEEASKDNVDKTANDYENCTFESDDSTPRTRRSTSRRTCTQNSDLLVEEELLSLTETSDHSDWEDKIRKLKEELQKEKMKAEALEKKQRKIKRSAMRKEAMSLENELKMTRDDINKKMAEIKTAAAHSLTPTTPSTPRKSKKTSSLPRRNILTSPRQDTEKFSQKSSNHSTPVSSRFTPRSEGNSESSTHEVEESLIEVLDDDDDGSSFRSVEHGGVKKDMRSKSQSSSFSHEIRSSVGTKIETSDIPEELKSNEMAKTRVDISDNIPTEVFSRTAKTSTDQGEGTRDSKPTRSADEQKIPRFTLAATSFKKDSTDIPKKFSEHLDSVCQSMRSVPTELPSLDEERGSRSQGSETPEEISEQLNSVSRSTTSVPEELPSFDEERSVRSQASETPEEISERSYTPIPTSHGASEESSKTGDRKTSVSEQSPKTPETYRSYTEPASTTSSLHKSPNIEESPHTNTAGDTRKKAIRSGELSRNLSERLASSSDKSLHHSEEVAKPSYTEPEGETLSPERSPSNHETKDTSSILEDLQEQYTASDISRNSRSVTKSEISSISRKSRERESSMASKHEQSEKGRLDTKTLSLASECHDEQFAIMMQQLRGTSRAQAPLNTTSPEELASNRQKSLSETSSIAEEIASGYGDEEFPGIPSTNGGQARVLIIGDDEKKVSKADEIDAVESKQGDVCEYTAPFTSQEIEHLSGSKQDDDGGDRKVFERSESLQSREEDTSKVKAQLGPGEEGKYSTDEGSISEEISEIEELSGLVENSNKEEVFEMITSEDINFEERKITDESRDITQKSRHVANESRAVSEQPRYLTMDSRQRTIETQGGASELIKVAEKSRCVTEELHEETEESRIQPVIDNITEHIYQDIMVDMMQSICELKNSKTHRLEKSFDESETDGQLIEVLTDAAGSDSLATQHKAKEVPLRDNKAVRGKLKDAKGYPRDDTGSKGHVETDRITKDLLSDAILQMMEIKRRKKQKNLQSMTRITTQPPDVRLGEKYVTEKALPVEKTEEKSPTGKTSAGKSTEMKSSISPGGGMAPRGATSSLSLETSPLGKLPGFGGNDQETSSENARSQTFDDAMLRRMNNDISGLLGSPLDDDDDDDDFPVNEVKISDILSDDNEPSFPDYPPMFAVPHSVQEVIPLVNLTVDLLLEQKYQGMPLDACVPQAQFLAGESENELECSSLRSYRRLVFDLTKETFIDTVSQHEPATRPPWLKAKWKGGQKLSRNFKRWRSDEEVRAAVLQRVTNLIGLGVPRATMATLPRKTPMRGNKKDNVDAILIEELRQEEPLWTDYEEDETSVKFQVADAILHILLEDTARVCSAIEAKRHVPDDVLIV